MKLILLKNALISREFTGLPLYEDTVTASHSYRSRQANQVVPRRDISSAEEPIPALDAVNRY
jgi:hypothetical protein